MMSVNNTAKAKVSYHLAFLRPGTNLENTEFHKSGPTRIFKRIMMRTLIKRAVIIALPCLASLTS